jgi:two-component system cell cycle response regulator
MANKRALVVDDSKVGRLTMKKRLEAIGVVVDLAESGSEAMDYLAQRRPDVIFMDHLMPEMDGFEATRRIKSSSATRHIPVIIVSGSDEDAFVREARSIGALNAITKPPPAGVLEAILAGLPEMVAAPAPSEVAEIQPQPVAAERPATPYMEESAVCALVEQMLGEAIERLHGDLLAGLTERVQAEFEHERQALHERTARVEELLEQTAQAIADLRRQALAADRLGQQLHAVEQRLLPLESAAGRAVPEIDDLLERMEAHVAPRLAEVEARIGRQEPMLDDLRQELLTKVDDRHAQVEQSVRDMVGRFERLSEDMSRLSDGALASETGHDQRYAAIEQRLTAIESAEHTPGPDLETVLAAVDARIEPRLVELGKEVQAMSEVQSSEPLEDVLRERLLAELQEQHATLRSELHAELAAQGEGLQARIEEELEQLTTRYEQERTQLAAGLEEQQTRLGGFDEAWPRRLEALEARFEEMAPVDVDDHVQRALEQRIAQMREIIGAALQPSYPPRGPRAAEAEGEVTTIEHETESARAPATEADQDIEARVAARLADAWNDRLRAEAVKFEGKLRTLTVMVAVGGAALLAAIAMIALLR